MKTHKHPDIDKRGSFYPTAKIKKDKTTVFSNSRGFYICNESDWRYYMTHEGYWTDGANQKENFWKTKKEAKEALKSNKEAYYHSVFVKTMTDENVEKETASYEAASWIENIGFSNYPREDAEECMSNWD